MSRKRMSNNLAAIAATVTLLMAPAALAQTDETTSTEQPAAPVDPAAVIAQLGIDMRASAELSAEELQARIASLEAALGQPDLPAEVRPQLEAMLGSDQATLSQLSAAATAAEPATEDSAAEEPVTEEPVIEETTTEETTEETVVEEPAATEETTTEETTTEETVVEKPATTEEATTEETVVEEPATTEETTTEETTTEETTTEEATTTETTETPEAQPSVEEAPVVSAAAEEAAKKLLADATPPEELSDLLLRERIDQYRDLLAEPDLSRETSDALRGRLKADREVLRVRVAEQQAKEAEVAAAAAAATQAQASGETLTAEQEAALAAQQAAAAQSDDEDDDGDDEGMSTTTAALLALAPLALIPALPLIMEPDEEEIPQILLDTRPAIQLDNSELSRRIQANLAEQRAPSRVYTRAEARFMEQQLADDRLELRQRVIAARQARAQAYQDYDYEGYQMPINVDLPETPAPPEVWAAEVDDAGIWQQLVAAPREPIVRHYSRAVVMRDAEKLVSQPRIREALPSVELDTITFGSGEAFVREEELFDLDRIARLIEAVVAVHPDEVFLIEGHTDAVGSDAFNLRLSRQRAEAVRDAIVTFYLVPPENLVTAGLGERYLKIWTPAAEPENRRVSVRRITPLVTGYAVE